MKQQLVRLARRLRRAAIECHVRGMRPASEWLDNFALDVDRILAEVRLGEQVGHLNRHSAARRHNAEPKS